MTPELVASGAIPVAADLATGQGCATLIDTALAELGGIDLLVNNVGGTEDPLGFLETDDAHWAATFDLNFLSTVRVTRAALPSLIERQGSVVNVSSINSRLPAGAPAAYSAAKAALTALGKSLAEEFGPLGVRVNTVTPGPVRTGIWEDPGRFGGKMAAGAGTEHAEFFAGIPQAFGVTTGRISEPREVATLISFLLSGLAGNITGADYVIDGGTIKAI